MLRDGLNLYGVSAHLAAWNLYQSYLGYMACQHGQYALLVHHDAHRPRRPCQDHCH